MNRIAKDIYPWVIALILFGVIALPGLVTAAGDPFPSYPCIKANVAFWKKVYAEYPSSTGLIHDTQDLGIVYEVVRLAGDDSRQGRELNEQQLKVVKEKYQRILNSLAEGGPPTDPDQKRVAALFSPRVKAATLRAAAENIRFQRCLSDRFRAGVVRSGRYLGQIKEVMSHYGLPTDLAYLPHVESSFDYQAYSKSGAAGIWQLIRSTGSRFLTINTTLDERRDPILATHAAAKYLRGNFKRLDSWPLALTAYNHGLTSMLRAKNSLGCYEKIYHGYDNQNFGFASRNFYAEFLAAREIAKNYRVYFPDLRLDPPLRTRTFTVNRAAGIKVLERHLKVDLATLAALNPALGEPVWSGGRYVPKGYHLRLPTGAGKGYTIAALPPAPAQTGQKSRASHRVKPGETVSSIARRYGISTRELIAGNKLGAKSMITAGQKLRIPSPTRSAAKKAKAGGSAGPDKDNS